MKYSLHKAAIGAAVYLVLAFSAVAAEQTFSIPGQIVDADTGKPLGARVYLRRDDSTWFFPTSEAPGTAYRYEKRNAANTNAMEYHTTVSAFPFKVELPAGRYTINVERGKEYLPFTNQFTVESSTALLLRVPLQRWVNMAERGWFSGDTHVHRTVAELGNVMLAEDVNVVHPMVNWTTTSTVSPAESPQNMKGDFGFAPVRVDDTHFWHPRNTEYEIFRVGTKTHQLGAMVIINHKTPFAQPVFPLAPIIKQARAEGALLDMEKQIWPWSFVILPLAGLDLFELSNNHVWRSEYGVRGFGVPAPTWMKLAGRGSETEADWISYNLQTYYALLNCGFRLRPTASTGQGVHPVPLGYSRVYVRLRTGFSYDDWMRGLGAGRSFVTTGPMLMTTVNGQDSGYVFKNPEKAKYRIAGEALSEKKLAAIEVVVNGDVVRKITPANEAIGKTFRSVINETIELDSSSWMVVRCFEEAQPGRTRFAHTAPWHLEVEGKPLRAKREQVDYFVKRVEEEITRNTGVIPDEGLAEFKEALAAWKKIAATAK
jgi:hypothetical protein